MVYKDREKTQVLYFECYGKVEAILSSSSGKLVESYRPVIPLRNRDLANKLSLMDTKNFIQIVESGYTVKRDQNNSNKFKLTFCGPDRSKDRIVTVHYDNEREIAEWDQMPPEISMEISTSFKYFDLKRRPDVCIRLAINQLKDFCQTLRSE